MDIIKALKENEKPFGLMSEELQAKTKEMGRGCFQLFMAHGQWLRCPTQDFNKDEFVPGTTYRLLADYQEPAEDGYETIEIVNEEGALKYLPEDNGEVCWFITTAQSDANFAGYLYADAIISSMPVRYDIDGVGHHNFYFAKEDAFRTNILRPTHVVFKK
ncbi:hypothetical protein LCGC14_0362350 [marine sediment metagenome]|uniref:Uncharacterized protein n=1 Tax=marine sediment metagenome TaxID=412755 RepID=A0A0F9TQM4_9ZZZZ